MILGRSTELQSLQNYYNREQSQIIILYGQKGVGKTALVNEFLQGKEHCYFEAEPGSERQQCYLFGKELSHLQIPVSEYPTFHEIFQEMTQNITKKAVLVIDEFQNICKGESTFLKELIFYLDHAERKQPVMVILCSSSIGWVENSMIGRFGMFAKRITGFLKLKELGFAELVRYFVNFSFEDCIGTYAVLGGVPLLWKQFDDTFTLEQNIVQSILNENKVLYGYGSRFVAEELRETSVYNTILAAIAEGRYKLNELYLHTGFSRAKISVYLKNLMELEIVEKVFSFDTAGKENAQKGIYSIQNHIVYFYYKYIYPNKSKLSYNERNEFYSRFIKPTMKSYIAEFFVDICQEYLEYQNMQNKLPIQFHKIGKWVGKVGTIDFVMQDLQNRTMVGICNWEKPMMTYADFEWLIFCAEQAKLDTDYIILFSAGRFEERLNLEAKLKKNIRLVTLDQL